MSLKINATVSRIFSRQNLITTASLLLLACSTGACKSDYNAVAKQRPAGETTAAGKMVKLVAVAETPVERTLLVTGTLAAYDQATLSVKVPGRLRAISIDLGSVVHKGDKIAEIDPTDYQLRLQQAEAALAQARARLGLSPDGSDDLIDIDKIGIIREAQANISAAKLKLDRSTMLLKQGVISQAEFDSAEIAHKVALSRYQDSLEEIHNRQALLAQRRSELAIAQQQIADTAIYASFDGVVQEKRASLGEYLAAGAPLATIVRMNPLRLRAEVPEREVSSVRAGQRVRVTVEGDTNSYGGAIMRLSPTITEQNRMLMIEAEVANNGSLRPGSFVRGEILTENKNMVVTVPTKSIVNFAGIEKVVMVDKGKAVEKPITTGRRFTDGVEVLTGLKAGDQIVMEPGNLQSGQPVTIAQ